MAHLITSACDGCSACERQCPVQAISGEFKRLYTIDPVRCIDCGVCGEICYLEAVLSQHGEVVRRVPRDQRPRPVVDANMCNGCGMCVDYCPFDCLRIVGGPFSGLSVLQEPLACVSCDECVDICIKGAISMRPLDLETYRPEERVALLEHHLTDYVQD